MKTLIAYASKHHQNTEKVACAMAKAASAQTFDVSKQANKPINTESFDLIGFGSGIYGGKWNKRMVDFINNLPQGNGKRAFVFATSTFMKPAYVENTAKLLKAKGYTVVDTFQCKGFNTFAPFKLVGGLDKGRPNEDDLLNAEKFIQRISAE